MVNDISCIILCAGTGSRMNCETKNKVCFDVLGKPAVVRVIETLQECGIQHFVVVVGSKAESVMSAVSGIKGVTFAYQKEQSGTGNAAMCGLNVLNDFGIDGPVMMVMGDKLIDKAVFEKLIKDFYSKNSDVSLITQPSDFNPSGGKIVISEGKVLGIVEHLDVLLLRVREEMKKGKTPGDIYVELNLTEKQRTKVDAKLKALDAPCEDVFIAIGGKKLSSEDILSSGIVNCATYLYKRNAINDTVFGLESNNVQNEIYFTDTIMKIAQTGIVSYVTVPEKSLIHTFNTMEELKAINDFFKEENSCE